MSKKFKQILEGKHRNHHRNELNDLTAFAVVHEIGKNRLLDSETKMRLIEGFCQNALTVYEISLYFKSENLDL